jgi:hypothetical protein
MPTPKTKAVYRSNTNKNIEFDNVVDLLAAVEANPDNADYKEFVQIIICNTVVVNEPTPQS